jgi:hypothetical protein
VSAPPPRLTPEQKDTAATLRAEGVPDGIALDAACGRVDLADVRKWCAEWKAARSTEAAKWGWQSAAPTQPRKASNATDDGTD